MVPANRILFLTLSNDVGSDRLVSDLGRQGAACAVLGPANCFAALPRSVGARYPLSTRLGAWASTVVLRARLAATMRAWRADRIVPLDELAALVLRSIAADHRTAPDIRDVLVGSFGRIEGYHAACHRVPLMKLAARHGVRVPLFSEAIHASASGGLRFPLLVKRDHSSGSGGVVLVKNAAGLKLALRRARIKNRTKRAMAQAAGFRHGDSPILLQQYVGGELAMRTVACRDGTVLDGISLLAVQVHPKKRASTMVKAIDNPEMTEAVRRLVAALGCSGFVSFDFIVDAGGQAFLIEMNPRPIGSTHLGRLFGHDLCMAFLSSAVVEPTPLSPAIITDDHIVALFPKELERDPSSHCLDRGSDIYHDVPREEPEVLEAYLRHLGELYPTRLSELRLRLGTPAPTPSPSLPWPSPATSEICL